MPTIPLSLRYVDDTIAVVHLDEIDAFHKHLREQNASIHAIEENEKPRY